jgi:hypothetical protein
MGLLGIAPSRRWRDPKDCRRYPKVPQGYAEGSAKMTKHQPKGSSKMTKHRRVRRGPAPEGGALNRRDASGSAEAKDDEGEVPRSLSKVVAKGRRTSRNPEVPRTVRSHTLEGYDKNLRVRRATQEWRTMKATPHEACQRPLPKVPEGQKIRDPGRSIQVGLSNLGKLPNTPIVTS